VRAGHPQCALSAGVKTTDRTTYSARCQAVAGGAVQRVMKWMQSRPSSAPSAASVALIRSAILATQKNPIGSGS
jgi:hypothetical protein